MQDSLSLFTQEARPEVKEFEVFAALEREARRQGAEDFRFMLARSSAPEVGLRPADRYSLKKGEAVSVLIAASYQRYWAELGQTFCLGRPSPEITKSCDLASQAYRELTARTQAGVSRTATAAWLSEVPSPAARDSMAAYGVGNGIGLDLTEAPDLGEESSGEIKPGMTLTLRVCFTGKDCGNVLISRPHRVTETGLESLVSFPTDLVTIGA